MFAINNLFELLYFVLQTVLFSEIIVKENFSNQHIYICVVKAKYDTKITIYVYIYIPTYIHELLDEPILIFCEDDSVPQQLPSPQSQQHSRKNFITNSLANGIKLIVYLGERGKNK